jgi:phage terminase Nu1 subunit (DNA packaging protein)
MTDEQKELEELRKYKAEKELTVEQKELEELREYKAEKEKAQSKENEWGMIILFVVPMWVAAIISCICLGAIRDTRDDIFTLLQRTEDQVKEINSKLPYGCGANGMIASLYEECPN